MMEFVDNAIDFAKNKIDKVMDIWEGLDDNKKKLLVGCAVAAISVIVVASIAYSIGKSQGRRIAFDEEDF
jgi:flagellar biosynthesis/type III secretory pathway M-ring protein FliF/YscJ